MGYSKDENETGEHEKEIASRAPVGERFQQLRLEVQNDESIKKTGRNNFGNYDYYQLKDFMPKVIRLLAKYHLVSAVTVFNDEARLEISDDGRYDKANITFSMPIIINSKTDEVKRIEEGKNKQGAPMKIESTSTDSAKDAMKTIGAAITYARRYLWITALELTETDQIEAEAEAQALKENRDKNRAKPSDAANKEASLVKTIATKEPIEEPSPAHMMNVQNDIAALRPEQDPMPLFSRLSLNETSDFWKRPFFEKMKVNGWSFDQSSRVWKK
jgi:hypothetical protein